MKNDRVVLALAITGGLAVYTAMVFAFFSAQGESRTLFLFLLGVPLGVALLAFPRAALFVLAFFVYFVRWLYDTLHVLPREFTWMVDILIVMLVVRTMFTLPFRKEKLAGIVKFVFLIVAFALLSAIINRNGRMVFIGGIRLGFRYVLLFIAAYQMRVSAKWMRRYFVFLFIICLFQLPVVVSQFFEYGWRDPDRISGTLGWGETPGMGIFLLLLVSYLVSKMIEEGRFRITYLAIMIVISVLPILGEVKFYYMIMPLLLLLIIRSEVIKRPALALLIVLSGTLIIIGANYAILRTGAWMEGRNPLTMLGHLPEVFETELRKEKTGEATRSSMFLNALHLASATPRIAAIGEGPGSITKSVLIPNDSPKVSYYSEWGLGSNSTTAFCWLLIEYGYGGVGLFLVLFYWIFRRASYLRASSDIQTRSLGRTLECITFLYVAWMFYVPSWTSDVTSFTFWPTAGVLVGLSYREQAAQANAALARAKAARQGKSFPADAESHPHALPSM